MNFYRYSLFLLLLFSGNMNAQSGSSKTGDRPNIVLFLVDDMGWQDTSVPFWTAETPLNQKFRTPNMERLAAEGLKFTQAYASAICSPTRVSLITGMNAARHRVTNWTLHKDVTNPGEREHPVLQYPPWNVNGVNPLNAEDPRATYATPFPKLLQNAGYKTIHVGKAHFGAIGTPGADPLNLGFDINIAGHGPGAPGSYYGKQNFGNTPGKDEVWAVPGLEKYHGKEIYLTEALTREALAHLDMVAADGDPFFLYMSHYAVHSPFMEDPRFYQRYLDRGYSETEAKYASMVEGMDQSLGDILDYLDKNHLSDNTIVIFMSDNGGVTVGARSANLLHSHNAPLAGGKGSVYEGGIREPMMVKWPGVTKGNTTTDTPLIIEDFYPTILEMAGVVSPDIVQELDGKSFVASVEGKVQGDRERPLFWHFPNGWGPDRPEFASYSCVRLGDWKLIYFHQDRKFELYNIREDIGEKNNLAELQPEKARHLSRVLTDYLKSVNAQMPLYKESGRQVPWPAEVLK